tara:strand:- start:38 stop:226 length:189 start_codon:yes stop_codon:yes gene_type:complete
MNRFTYNLISAILLLTSILWVVYIVVSSWGTKCFNLFDSYATIIILLLEIIWSNFIKINAFK